jgi:hypothetical protein
MEYVTKVITTIKTIKHALTEEEMIIYQNAPKFNENNHIFNHSLKVSTTSGPQDTLELFLDVDQGGFSITLSKDRRYNKQRANTYYMKIAAVLPDSKQSLMMIEGKIRNGYFCKYPIGNGGAYDITYDVAVLELYLI